MRLVLARVRLAIWSKTKSAPSPRTVAIRKFSRELHVAGQEAFRRGDGRSKRPRCVRHQMGNPWSKAGVRTTPIVTSQPLTKDPSVMFLVEGISQSRHSRRIMPSSRLPNALPSGVRTESLRTCRPIDATRARSSAELEAGARPPAAAAASRGEG